MLDSCVDIAPRPGAVPRADVFERPDDVLALIDLPGMHADDLSLTLEGGRLVIRGRVTTLRMEEYELVSAEYGVADYACTLVLPDDVDSDRIEANLQNGVLRLVVPRKPAGPSRRIEVARG